MSFQARVKERYLQIRHIDRCIRLFGIIIRQDPCVGKRPAEDIMYVKDGDGLGFSGDVRICASERGLSACWDTLPFEAGFATVAGHGICV